MTSFYSQQTARRCRRAAQAGRIAAAALTAAGWGVCAYLCTRVRTANAAYLFRWVLALSILPGWAAILILSLRVRPSQAEYRHQSGLLQEEAEDMEGVLSLLPGAFQIPRGIRVCQAALETAEGSVKLRLDAKYAGRLPAGKRVRVRVARQFITGWEVLHEDA